MGEGARGRASERAEKKGRRAEGVLRGARGRRAPKKKTAVELRSAIEERISRALSIQTLTPITRGD